MHILQGGKDVNANQSGIEFSVHCFIEKHSLAQQMHISQRQLSRNMQELYGMSFRQKTPNLRMDQAT